MSTPNKWINILSLQRSRSGSGNKDQEPSHSPPESLAVADPRYDDNDSTRPSTPPLSVSTVSVISQSPVQTSSGSNSPTASVSGSLPKKSWERHFRSFLAKKNQRSYKEDALDLQRRGNRATPPDSPSHSIVSDGTVIRSRRHTLDVQAQVNASVSDSAVRGGSLFKAAFRSVSQQPNTLSDKSIGSGLSKSYEADPFIDQKGRKNKSFESLDATIRQGQDLSRISRLHRLQLLAPNQRIPEGDLTKLVDKTSDMERGAIIGTGGIATELERHVSSIEVDRNNNYGPSHLRSIPRDTKVAFTEFHNSQLNNDTTSAFLGEEKSVAGGKMFTSLGQSNRQARASSNSLTSLDPLATVYESRSSCLLNAVTGTDKWISGRRYSLIPAIMSVCPVEVLPSICCFPSKGRNNFLQNNVTFPDDFPSVMIYSEQILGEADITDPSVSLDQQYQWSRKIFLLKMNYLFEYDVTDSFDSRPRGFVHLEFSSVYPHSYLENVLALDVFMSPCARAKRKVFLIRLKSEDEMKNWISFIDEAAKLRINDIFDYDTSEDAAVLGTGRYATVRPARRRRGRRIIKGRVIAEEEDLFGTGTIDFDASTNRAYAKSGIMKKKLSFSSIPRDVSSNLNSSDYDSALKIVDKNIFWDRVMKNQERLDTLVREAAVQATLTALCSNLPTFMRLKSIFETSDHFILELDLLDNVDLFRYVSSKGHLPEVDAAHVVRDLLTSLEAMKKLGIAHRDLKPANIFMVQDFDATDDVRVKLGDFGMAAFVGTDNQLHGRCGTPGYVAPEILVAGVHKGYDNKVDVFSLGVTMYILLCGYEPFFGESDEELIQANKVAKVDFPDGDWKNVSVEGRDLVERLLEPDPKKRIEASDALKHPWITRRTSRPRWLASTTESGRSADA